ncbi:hypothetical protein A1Q2_03319 [Trichosporon asahii var. asahii CBS 8904]|uniref:Nicotinamide N-methyltransferase n=1 Tax=Trichosporon asahii var. asahii (strain CBS 8904) TaxID=1220162 RepID=K1VS61_TRIAC|nr:hypothetical protein A1Q2_03319 [Trichosporon asahii var. asahii CBS 8904]
MTEQAERPPLAASSAASASTSAGHSMPSTSTTPPPGADPRDGAVEQEEDDDDLDIFDSGLSSLFNVPPIGFSSSRGKPHVYTPPPTSGLGPVDVWTASPPASVFSKLQAQHLWLAAVYLADKIALGAIQPEGSVLELGAGAGLPSVVTGLRRKADGVARQGGEGDDGEHGEHGEVVVCTDYDDETVVANIARNVAAASSPVIVRGHSWGTPTDELLSFSPQGYSLLLADTLWSTETHGILLDSILALLAKEGVAHLAAGLHTGRGPHDRFRKLAEERGLVMEKMEEVIYDCGEWKRHEDEGMGLEEERGVVIYYTLHR